MKCLLHASAYEAMARNALREASGPALNSFEVVMMLALAWSTCIVILEKIAN